MTALARSHVERFRTVVGRRLGFQFDDGKLDFLADILRARLDATASQSASHYLDWFDGNSSDVELPVVAESITVGETYFFRHADQFRAFAEVMLPDRLRSRAQDRMIRIVSAGCASGDEAYTLAILVEKHVADLAAWNVDIRGLDVTPSAIGRARRAIYSTWSLRETSTHEREASFVRRGREFELDPRIKQMVTFECRNLVDDDPTFWRPGSLDVVFCRNVTMYFAPEVARAVIDRIAASLAPGGYLVLGHAETLRGISRDFHLCQTHETFYYQRRSVAREGDDATRAASAPGFALESPSSKTPPSEADSWVDVIQRASDRIAALSGDVGRRSAPALATTATFAGVTPARPDWDLSAAMDLMRLERYGDALENLCALPVGSHLDPDAQLLRGVLLTNAGRIAEAERVCAELLSADELNVGAHYLMALCCEHAGHRREAMDHDRSAIYLDAQFAMPHLHLGLLARRSGDPASARPALRRALTLLAREDAARVLLFGGGFGRGNLIALCTTELRACGGEV